MTVPKPPNKLTERGLRPLGLCALMLASACGPDEEGDVGTAGMTSGGSPGAGGTGEAGSGGNANQGGNAANQFTPPDTVDPLADGYLSVSERRCDPGELEAVVNLPGGETMGGSSNLAEVSLSEQDGIETYSASTTGRFLRISWNAPGTDDGAALPAAGMVQIDPENIFCFEGAVIPRQELEGVTYYLVSSAALSRVGPSGGCSDAEAVVGVGAALTACGAAAIP